jgi:L-alanine-DL-glutamate epimerase-like enolase superfamily enzyme|tara:strand:+ start:677 stop:1711 length:1035 start_codon:yes stop_codon:yes gene_type:complete
MKFSFETYRIECTHPFGISRSSHSFYDVVFIYLEHNGLIGRGEAAPSNRYNESTERILSVLNRGITVPDNMDDIHEFFDHFSSQCERIKALEVAFSMATLDLWCQIEGKPLYEYFNADPKSAPQTSFTISIGDMDLLPQKIAEAKPYDILKVKLGTSLSNDKSIIEQIRLETDKIIRVDANEGWDLDTGLLMSFWLADNNVEFIEQPFKSTNLSDTAKLKSKSPLPIIADENSVNSFDILKIENVFDGINIKLMKCGTLFEAIKMVKMARERDMQIMLGCMIESSVAITAAAHISPLVDYADLDGNLLISNDPYKGVVVENGRLTLPSSNGLGISLVNNDTNLM